MTQAGRGRCRIFCRCGRVRVLTTCSKRARCEPRCTAHKTIPGWPGSCTAPSARGRRRWFLRSACSRPAPICTRTCMSVMTSKRRSLPARSTCLLAAFRSRFTRRLRIVLRRLSASRFGYMMSSSGSRLRATCISPSAARRSANASGRGRAFSRALNTGDDLQVPPQCFEPVFAGLRRVRGRFSASSNQFNFPCIFPVPSLCSF